MGDLEQEKIFVGFEWFPSRNKISLAHGAYMKFLSKPMVMVSYVVEYYLT
jgi:hypothetical protein